MSADAPIPTLAALAGLVEALEAVPCDDQCALSAETTDPACHNDACPRRATLTALAVWRTRLPLRHELELRRNLRRECLFTAVAALNPTDVDIVLDVVDAALDARMGRP